MKLRTGLEYPFIILKNGIPTSCKLAVQVEPRAGTLNQETGEIISRTAFYESIHEALLPIEDKDWGETKRLKYLPKTLEILAIQLWEWLDETLPAYAKLTHVRLQNDQYFVEYKSKTPYRQRGNYEVD